MTSSAKQNCALFLVGFMGAGKSTVGCQLAKRLGWEFADLDVLIEKREKRTIAEIFRDSGEPAFRKAESSALLELLSDVADSNRVIALGGGAYVQSENAQAIRLSGVPVVFLDASLEELIRRCQPAAGTRPLFQDENRFRQLYESRRQAYMRADIRIQTAGLTVDEVADAVIQRLQLAARAVHE